MLFKLETKTFHCAKRRSKMKRITFIEKFYKSRKNIMLVLLHPLFFLCSLVIYVNVLTTIYAHNFSQSVFRLIVSAIQFMLVTYESCFLHWFLFAWYLLFTAFVISFYVIERSLNTKEEKV